MSLRAQNTEPNAVDLQTTPAPQAMRGFPIWDHTGLLRHGLPETGIRVRAGTWVFATLGEKPVPTTGFSPTVDDCRIWR